MKPKQPTEKFVFLSKKTNQPYSVSVSPNGPDAEFCNDTTVRLVMDEWNHQMFCVDTLEEAVHALHFAPEWYNSDVKSPMIGEDIKSDIKIARMEIKFHAVEYLLPMILNAGIFDTRDLLPCIAKKMAKDLPPAKRYVDIILDSKKSGYTRKEIEARIGSIVHSRFFQRELLAVCDAREEYSDVADLELICRG